MKIAVHYYTEIDSKQNVSAIGENFYITNEGGRQFLVEILA